MLHTSKTFTVEYELEDADVCVLGIPFDSTSISHPLQRYAPTLIRSALKNTTFNAPLKIHDAGDVNVAPGSFEETDKRIRDTIKAIRRQNPKAFPVFLGGEHSVSLSIVRELKPKTIVVLDAHPDLLESYENVTYSHTTWLYHAIAELGCSVVLLGARSWTPEEKETMKKLGVRTELPQKFNGPVYVSIDMDVFDPLYAPETGFAEPNGLAPNDVFGLIEKIFKANVIGLDIVEISSDRLNCPTANLAARTLVHAMGQL